MTGIWAKSILASEHATTGKRIDTLLVRMPRSILAEFNTHRAFSRNAASSRAIPVGKLIEQVESEPFIPMQWTKNQPGMQGYALLDAVSEARAEVSWLKARDRAVTEAKKLVEINAHKQIVNRLLEPWMWTIVCVTATEWENFFDLRDHPAAEPHMQLLARAIYDARDRVEVQILEPGEWHMPFTAYHLRLQNDIRSLWDYKKLSVARCASTSYKTVDGFDMDLGRAEKLYESLLSDPLHASPFEHQAQADEQSSDRYSDWRWKHPWEHRNFVGFRQLRSQIEAEAPSKRLRQPELV